MEHSQRKNGAWSIDENLACWLSTQAIAALPFDGEIDTGEIPLHWILSCQHRCRNPFTGAAEGGWGWTDLSGAVPDVDDTASALLALARCQKIWLDGRRRRNRDHRRGCRGSSLALGYTKLRWRLAHLLSRMGQNAVRPQHKRPDGPRVAVVAVVARSGPQPGRHGDPTWIRIFLKKNARSDSAWEPLWFGNESQPNESNPVYGTSKVLAAYRDFDRLDWRPAREAIAWLISNQNRDGGFGGGPTTGSSVEETALAIEALAPVSTSPAMRPALNRALDWLIDALEKKRTPPGQTDRPVFFETLVLRGPISANLRHRRLDSCSRHNEKTKKTSNFSSRNHRKNFPPRQKKTPLCRPTVYNKTMSQTPTPPSEQALQVPETRPLREQIRLEVDKLVEQLDRSEPIGRDRFETMGRELLGNLNLPTNYLGWTMVAIGSAFWRDQVAATPYNRRLLLLPHCIRDTRQCPARFNEWGLLCRDCGACETE